MRMTGRQVVRTVTTTNPADLQALIRHLEAAWPNTEPTRRAFGDEILRTMFPLHKRTRKPREGRMPEPPDEPRPWLLTRPSMVLSVT